MVRQRENDDFGWMILAVILVLLGMVIVCGCDTQLVAKPLNQIDQLDKYEHAHIQTYKDERGNTHEYLMYWAGQGNGGGSMTHYPDCKFCNKHLKVEIE